MPSANLDLVRSLYAAWRHGDWSSAEWADPEIEFVVVDGPSPGIWTGVNGMVEGFRKVLDAWEGYRGEAEEYREIDEEKVLALITVSGRGKASGLHVETPAANLFHIRDGKVTRLAIYWDRDLAFADLGLSWRSDPADPPE